MTATIVLLVVPSHCNYVPLVKEIGKEGYAVRVTHSPEEANALLSAYANTTFRYSHILCYRFEQFDPSETMKASLVTLRFASGGIRWKPIDSQTLSGVTRPTVIELLEG